MSLAEAVFRLQVWLLLLSSPSLHIRAAVLLSNVFVSVFGCKMWGRETKLDV